MSYLNNSKALGKKEVNLNLRRVRSCSSQLFHHERSRTVGTPLERAVSVLPNPSMELSLIIILRTNLTTSEFVPFVKAIDSIESAHDRFKLDIYHTVLVGFVDLDLLDGTKLEREISILNSNLNHPSTM
jgi:hypothetical protein